jgi:AcrR family transcriptional regulator
MTPPSGLGRQLTADDWIQAGFAVLANGGPDALRIGRLCEELDVTKGSFYWHFTDFREYRTALANAWGSLQDDRRRRFDHLRDVDPGKRLAVMVQTLIQPQHSALERAMRIWSQSDDTVLASVQRSDRRVLCAVRQAFLDEGFDQDEARLRATTLFAAGIGVLHGADLADDPDDPDTSDDSLGDRLVDFMLRR